MNDATKKLMNEMADSLAKQCFPMSFHENERASAKWISIQSFTAAHELAEKEIDELKAENDRLLKVNDMNQLIIDGMRGVVAMARAVNNQRPDPRVTYQLKRFDADKLSDYRDEQVSNLAASLKSAVDALQEIAIEQEFYVKEKDYFHEVVRLNLQAQYILEELKAKHPDMFKGEE